MLLSLNFQTLFAFTNVNFYNKKKQFNENLLKYIPKQSLINLKFLVTLLTTDPRQEIQLKITV